MTFIMPYGGPTPSTRIAGRTLCMVTYVLTFLVSVGDIFFPSPTLLGVVDREWSAGLALILAVLSVVGLLAVATHRWRAEWVPATTVIFLLLQRSVPVWASLTESPHNLSAAAMMTLGGFCLAKRALDLWTFGIKTKAAAERVVAVDERR